MKLAIDKCPLDRHARDLIVGALNLVHRELYKPKRAEFTSQKLTPKLRRDIINVLENEPTAQV